MKKKLFIHIGSPKTGTTSLQKSVFPEISEIYFGRNIPNNQENDILNSLIEYIVKKKGKKQIFNKIKNIISKGNEKIFFISDETYSINHAFLCNNKDSMEGKADKILNLKKHIEDVCEVYIIMSIRKQVDIIPSFYAQMGGYNTLTLDQFINTIIKEEVFDFYKIANYYSKLFGKDKLIIWTMDEIFKDTQNWLKKIGKYIPIKNKNKIINNIQNTHENKRPIYRENSIILKIPKYIYIFFLRFRKNKIGPSKFAKEIAKILLKIQNLLIPENKRKKIDKIECNEKQKKYIFEYFVESNKKLEQEYGLNLKKYNFY